MAKPKRVSTARTITMGLFNLLFPLGGAAADLYSDSQLESQLKKDITSCEPRLRKTVTKHATRWGFVGALLGTAVAGFGLSEFASASPLSTWVQQLLSYFGVTGTNLYIPSVFLTLLLASLVGRIGGSLCGAFIDRHDPEIPKEDPKTLLSVVIDALGLSFMGLEAMRSGLWRLTPVRVNDPDEECFTSNSDVIIDGNSTEESFPLIPLTDGCDGPALSTHSGGSKIRAPQASDPTYILQAIKGSSPDKQPDLAGKRENLQEGDGTLSPEQSGAIQIAANAEIARITASNDSTLSFKKLAPDCHASSSPFENLLYDYETDEEDPPNPDGERRKRRASSIDLGLD